jgi:myo-inositol 2-dehydrogenase/D-chiro-inositol 1-dehydrogenase
VRIGLAGVGRIGAYHGRTLRAVPDVQQLVVADADPARAEQVARELGVEHVRDVDDLFGCDLDGIVVATATDAHPELIVRGVEAGLAVFCEKPVAADLKGTLAVVEAVGADNPRVQIGFQRRFDAGYTAARAAVQDGTLGWLHTVRATTLDPSPPPAAYIPRSGGLLRDCGVHDFDVLRWVTGREVVSVYAVGTNRGEEFFRAAGDVDTANVLLVLDDDTVATVTNTRYNGAGYDVRMEVLGSKDSLSVGLDERVPLRSAEPGVTWPTGTPYPAFMERFDAAYVAELRAFVDMAAGRTTSPCTVGDALSAFLVAEAAETSRREGRPVELSEVQP